MFDEDQLRKVLGNWIYPPVEGISFTVYDAGQDKVFAAISLPNQRRSIRPFLVRRVVDEAEKVAGAVFGMFERRHTDSTPFTVQEVQSLMRDGSLFREGIDSRSAATTRLAYSAVQIEAVQQRTTQGESSPADCADFAGQIDGF